MELKEKEAFFALYWNQEVCRPPYLHESTTVSFPLYHGDNCLRDSYLELKSLEDITDEDALVISGILYWSHLSKESRIASVKTLLVEKMNSQTNISGNQWNSIFQFLIKNGYAVPTTNSEGRTYTVAELMAEGVVKLKGK